MRTNQIILTFFIAICFAISLVNPSVGSTERRLIFDQLTVRLPIDKFRAEPVLPVPENGALIRVVSLSPSENGTPDQLYLTRTGVMAVPERMLSIVATCERDRKAVATFGGTLGIIKYSRHGILDECSFDRVRGIRSERFRIFRNESGPVFRAVSTVFGAPASSLLRLHDLDSLIGFDESTQSSKKSKL